MVGEPGIGHAVSAFTKAGDEHAALGAPPFGWRGAKLALKRLVVALHVWEAAREREVENRDLAGGEVGE